MLRQDYFSNFLFWISKTVIFSLKFSKNNPIRPVVAGFRDTYAPTSRKYVSTEPKARPYK